MTDELVIWLRAALDEDERMARAVTQGAWKLWGMDVMADPNGTSNYNTAVFVARTHHHAGLLTHNAQHIATWDPARALAEVDAKRRILDYCETMFRNDRIANSHSNLLFDSMRDKLKLLTIQAAKTLRLLALPYADRPGYREEWAP